MKNLGREPEPAMFHGSREHALEVTEGIKSDYNRAGSVLPTDRPQGDDRS